MIFLNIIELVAAALGMTYFFAEIIRHPIINRTSLLLIVFSLITILMGSIYYDHESRWMFVKVVCFVLVVAISIKWPRLAVFILISVATYQVLTSEGKSATIPLPILALSLLYCKPRINALFVIFFFSFIYLILCLHSELRSGVITSIISLSIIILPAFLRSGLIRIIPYFVVIYIGTMTALFLMFIAGLMPQAFATASNIERSSMIFQSVIMAPDYLFSGPRLVFDNVVSNEIQETGITTLYETDYGVDPHNFVLSVWKDEGLIVAFIWLMMFIGIIRLIVNKHFSQKTSQSLGVISLLVYPIVHFTLSPPSTDNRLMVAAFVGLSLFLLDRTYRLSSNRNMILSKDALLKI
jgi:hypothetical protein